MPALLRGGASRYSGAKLSREDFEENVNSAQGHAKSKLPGEGRGTCFLRGVELIKVTAYQAARDTWEEGDLQCGGKAK